MGSALHPRERCNYFPASPSCSITWFLEGQSQRIPSGDPLPAAIVLRGPQTKPVMTYNPGPVRIFMVLLVPDALRMMTGIEPTEHLDLLSAARHALPSDWLPMLDAVAGTHEDAVRIKLVEDFLEARWRVLRPESAAPVTHLAEWGRSLATRAMFSGLGRSTRQIGRRITAWTGLPQRRLLGMARAERALRMATRTAAAGSVDWPQLAVGAGYSDQAHLCRETRRFSGVSPAELLRRMGHDEAFWVYRLWGDV